MYYIKSKLVIKTDDETEKELLKEEKKLTKVNKVKIDKNVLAISSSVEIPFEKYNKYANKYKSDFALINKSNLHISLVVIDGKDEEEVASLNIPLTKLTYSITKTELKNKASIIATPESNLEPQLIQFIYLKIETFIGLEDDEIFVHYAWTNNENETPESSKYISATCTVNANKKRRSASITSEDTQEGNYYLWVQLVFNENTITEKFGPYAVKDHTTLVAANRETSASSGFLGNTEIPRNKIRSVTINNSFGTHDSDERSWDVSASNDGRYLAWSKAITDETDGTYYDVTIEGKGGVVANTNSAYLFANIGSGLTNKEVTITGLEYLDTGLVTNMTRMFTGSNNLVNLNLNTWNTRNLKNMNSMFWGCNNLKVLEIENFNTSNATDFGSMFRDCFSLEKLDVSKWDTSKATTMRRNVLWM